MTRRSVPRCLGSVVIAAAVLTGCGSPNADGWWDRGVHAVDGYWVLEEESCSHQFDETCTVAIEAATRLLVAKEPDARIVAVATTGYPVKRGRDSSELTINLGGLVKPRFVVFDLEEGSRRAFGLNCGPDMSKLAPYILTCWESEFELWRVTASAPR